MKKKHHFIPQLYLRYWYCKPHHKIWAYYKDPSKNPNPYGGNPQLVSPGKILFENFLYSIGEDQIVENWLGHVPDNLIGDAFSRISKNQPLSEEDEFYIKAFASLILTRHPRMKRSSKHIAEAMRLNADSPFAKTLIPRFKSSLTDKLNFHLNLQHISQELRSSWSFITSDIPVVTNVLTNVNQIMGERFYFYPLTPYTIALLLPLETDQKEIIIEDTETIMKINKIIAEFSDDILIANSSQIIEKTLT